MYKLGGMAALICLAAICSGWAVESNRLVVASLNPIATDLARQIGGARVQVVELMPAGRNPHEFSPSPAELHRAKDARILLAMGKKLETYLPAIRDGLGEGQEVLELGRMIPSLKANAGDGLFTCCPGHGTGGIDPHWWHSVKNVRRAARVLAAAFGREDPVHRDAYDRRYRLYDERLEDLDKWVRREVARIPRRERKLATPHAAFNYFCKAYGFEAVFVKGLTTEEAVRSVHLGHVAETIRKERIKVLFPEVASSDEMLRAMAQETGVSVGGVLFSGAPSAEEPTYEAMIRRNVSTIVGALAPAEE